MITAGNTLERINILKSEHVRLDVIRNDNKYSLAQTVYKRTSGSVETHFPLSEIERRALIMALEGSLPGDSGKLAESLGYALMLESERREEHNKLDREYIEVCGKRADLNQLRQANHNKIEVYKHYLGDK
jgi:hypothetical protein